MKDVMLVTGAGQISMAIARRIDYGKKIILGDKSNQNCKTIANVMTDVGFDVEPFEMDLLSRNSILAMIAKGQEYGEIKYLVNGADVSPSQAPVAAILKVDLYGTDVLLEEVGKVIANGGVGVTISSQSGWRIPQLTAEQDYQLAMTPTEELLELEILCPENIRDTLHAYQLAKRCNEKRNIQGNIFFTVCTSIQIRVSNQFSTLTLAELVASVFSSMEKVIFSLLPSVSNTDKSEVTFPIGITSIVRFGRLVCA